MLLGWLTALAVSLFPGTTAGAAPKADVRTIEASEVRTPDAWIDEVAPKTGGLRPDVLRMALAATECAASQGLVESDRLLTVIDYSLPSVEPRLWVVDRQSHEVLFEELVAHGKNSGGNLTTAFSNTRDSLQTSLGLFVTGDTYVGANGYSLRLDGLDREFNDRARERAIVMHGAPYVNAQTAKALGRLGRSWGCPAVSLASARRLIDTLKGGTPVFAYYPDKAWQARSRFLNGCRAS
jgi:hypothetical protein